MMNTINLRIARKQAKRRQDDERARARRIENGQPKQVRQLQAVQREQANRVLDAHRLGPGGDV